MVPCHQWNCTVLVTDHGAETKDMSTASSSLALSLSNLGDISVRRTELLVANSISDVELRACLSEMLAAKCPGSDTIEELWASSQVSLRKKDYLKFSHNIYELLDVVRKVISWEAIDAFLSVEGTEIFAEKIQGDNGSVSEPSTGDNAKTNKKSEKKKVVVFGKGTALVQFIKDTLLGAKTTLNSFGENEVQEG